MFNLKDKGDRSRPVYFFFALLCSVILLEYSTQKDYNNLDHQMSSLYRDRLMPANYLMRLNDELHKKQRWVVQLANEKADHAELQLHNDSVATLISLYEQTYLTNREGQLWSSFKLTLDSYNKAESQLFKSGDEFALQDTMITAFDQAIATLSKLSELQTEEGYKLQSQSKSILNGNFLQHSLEISLLFLIGILALHWLKNDFMKPDKPFINIGTTPSAN